LGLHLQLKKQIKMNRHISRTLIAATSLALIAGCRSSRGDGDTSPAASGEAVWQRQPLKIDGSDKDWVRPLPYFEKSEQLSYSISNDGQFVYIQMSTRSPQEQQKIIQGGMTMWINNQADKNISQSIGIGYPLDKRNDRDQQLMEQARPDRYKQKPATLEDRKDYELYNLNKDSTIQSFTYGDDNPAGVTMRMDYSDAGELIYEAAIPLATIYPANTSRSYVGKSLAVGFIIEGLPPSAQVPRGQGGGPEIGVGGGLGFGSFGSGGGLGLSIGAPIGGGGRGANKQLFRQGQIWQVVALARH
jgi:hypothetical protein